MSAIELEQSIDLAELERKRVEVKEHIAKYKSLKGLDIDPHKPPADMHAHIIHEVPQLPPGATKDDQYHCSYCERPRQFKHGAIVWGADKKLRLIGNICWKYYFNENAWDAMHADIRIFRRRQQFTELQGRYVPALKRCLAALRDGRQKVVEFSNFIDSFSSDFESHFPALTKALRHAANRNGRGLTVEGLIKQANGRYDTRIDVVYRFNGEQALLPRHTPIEATWNSAFKKIGEAIHQFEITDWAALSNRKFAGELDILKTRCQDAISGAEAVIQKVTAVRQFTSEANLSGIVKWTNHSDCELRYSEDLEYAISSNGFRSIGLRTVNFTWPTTVPAITCDGLEELQNLLAIGL